MTRLSDELRVLARRHPRETWTDHANLGPVAQFWLERHAMFRELDAIIRDGTEAALDDWPGEAELKSWLTRHLRWFLGQLALGRDLIPRDKLDQRQPRSEAAKLGFDLGLAQLVEDRLSPG